MKLRLLDNTLRLRLDRREVDALGQGEPQGAVTQFPGGEEFAYRIEPTSGAVAAAANAQGITVFVPALQLQAWAQDDQQVGIRECLPLAAGSLTLLIEKDFECLEPRSGEDQSNRFVNPKAR